MPIERAVPAMILAAAFTSLAFRSSILVVAISSHWAWVSLPTLSVCGVEAVSYTHLTLPTTPYV